MPLLVALVGVLLVAAAAAVGAGTAAAAGWPDGEPPDDEEVERSPEYLLAVIELGREPESEEDVLVVLHYAELLDKGDAVCEQDRQDLADIAAKAWDILEEDGYEPDLRELVASYGVAVPPELAPMDCVEVMAFVMAYIQSE